MQPEKPISLYIMRNVACCIPCNASFTSFFCHVNEKKSVKMIVTFLSPFIAQAKMDNGSAEKVCDQEH